MPRVLVPLADGFEEMEGIIIIDVLRRAGIEVVSASLKDGPITAARGTKHLADTTLDQALSQEFDMLVLPGGGPGAKALEADARVAQLLKEFHEKKKRIGAICAAPNALRRHNVIQGQDRFTMYPDSVQGGNGGLYTKERVVRNAHVTTSLAAGSAFEFALDIVEQLLGPEKKAAVAGPMYLPQ